MFCPIRYDGKEGGQIRANSSDMLPAACDQMVHREHDRKVARDSLKIDAGT